MDKKEFYVYRWYYINTNETFHIGKGKGQRYKEKLKVEISSLKI